MFTDTEIARDKARLRELIAEVAGVEEVHWTRVQDVMIEVDKILEKHIPTPRCGVR